MDNKYRSLRKSTGLKMSAFARKYNIPYRTLQGWELGKYDPPVYVYELLHRVVAADVKKEQEYSERRLIDNKILEALNDKEAMEYLR